MILYVIFSLLLIGAMLFLTDLPVVLGSILASGAGERWSIRILCPFILLAGLAVPFFIGVSPVSSSSVSLYIPSSPGEILSIGLATAFAILTTRQFSSYPAVPYSFMASIAGVALAAGYSPDSKIFLSYIGSWIVAPLLCAILAALTYRTYALVLRNKKIHLAILDSRFQVTSFLFSFLLLAVFAFNNSLLLSFLPDTLPLAQPVRFAIAAGCAVAVYPFLHRRISLSKWNIADIDLDINAQSIGSLIISMVLVFGLFSSPLPAVIGLAATPLPAGTLFVAALAGISLSRKRALEEGQVIVKSSLSAILSPVLSLMFAFCLARVLDGTVIGAMFLLVLIILEGGIAMFNDWQYKRDFQRQTMLSREQQVFGTQRSLSALEVKAEMTEKDLLDKLDGKRKELVDFALGIGDQKKFMEGFYADLKKVRNMPDGEDKDNKTDAMLSSLRERMYFTSEMNDFYARSEVLHRDFNRRLSEAYPNLTENERKLANLLRQGFSSKYIASLMNITSKSVEINRYRLRAKLGLDRSDNLVKFIKSI